MEKETFLQFTSGTNSNAILSKNLYTKSLEYEMKGWQKYKKGETDEAMLDFINASYACLQQIERDPSEGSKIIAKKNATKYSFLIQMIKLDEDERKQYQLQVISTIENVHDTSLPILCKRGQYLCEAASNFEKNKDNRSQIHKHQAIAICLYQQAIDIYMLALKQKPKNEDRARLKEWLNNCLDHLVMLKTSQRRPIEPNSKVANLISKYEEKNVISNAPKLKSIDKNHEKKCTMVTIHVATKKDDKKLEKDDKKLEKDQKKLKKRRRIAQEIIDTEESYIKSLAQVLDMYLLPLRDRSKNVATSVLSADQIKVLFSNLELIHSLNKKFFGDLRKQFSLWEDTADTQLIGDVFLKFAPFFKMYSQYVENFDESIVMLKSLEKNSAWRKFCKSSLQDGESSNLSLESFLIMPIQRIPRYKMLLSELLKYTDITHKDYIQLQQAVLKVGSVASHINEAVRTHENQMNIRELEKQFSEPPSFVAPHRLLVMTGLLIKKEKDRDVLSNFFLFNDILAYCSKERGHQFGHVTKIPLDKSVSVKSTNLVSDFANSDTNYSFQFHSSAESFEVYTNDQQQYDDWLQNLSVCILDQKCRRLSSFDQSEASNMVSFVAPILQQNKVSSICSLCKISFSTFTRRHHCLKCGKLVCRDCCLTQIKLGLHGEFQRVCDKCKPANNKSSREVVWQDDQSDTECVLCQEKFTTFNRRHHCRKCGSLVCNSCSLSRMPAEYSKVLQRVCDKCSPMEKVKWQPDNSATACTICEKEFTTFKRRHHCRKCGLLVCELCSPYRIVIYPEFSKVPERVCKHCESNIEFDDESSSSSLLKSKREKRCPCCTIL